MLPVRAITCVEAGIGIAAALSAGRAPARRALTGLLIVAGMALPWFAPPAAIPRVLLAFLSVLPILKATQIASDPEGFTARARIWHALAPFDVRRVKRIRPGFGLGTLMALVLHAALGASCLWALLRLRAQVGGAAALVRLLCGTALAYTWIEVAAGGITFIHRLAGFEIPIMQRAPLMARSLAEFWGERWNRPVGEWLRRFFFLPLARRHRPVAGVLAAFAVSGAFHAWMVAPATGPGPAAVVGAFFVVQGLAVVIEARLGVREWPAPAARAWTLLLLVATAPLFLWPFFELLGLSP